MAFLTAATGLAGCSTPPTTNYIHTPTQSYPPLSVPPSDHTPVDPQYSDSQYPNQQGQSYMPPSYGSYGTPAPNYALPQNVPSPQICAQYMTPFQLNGTIMCVGWQDNRCIAVDAADSNNFAVFYPDRKSVV